MDYEWSVSIYLFSFFLPFILAREDMFELMIFLYGSFSD